jgi:hypothetical protein
MLIDDRSIDEIKKELSVILDIIEATPKRTKSQVRNELNSFLYSHKGSRSWTDYNMAKNIIGWTFDKEEYEQLINTILTELGL